MKAAFEHIQPNRHQSSFLAYRRETNYFDFNWHYHPELELTLIEKGSGTRIVGDHTEAFNDGDLILLGSNLPHTWASDIKQEGQSAIIVQFRPSLLSESQMEMPEFLGIKALFTRSHLGISFGQEVAQALHSRLSNLLEMKGLDKLTELWHILDLLGQKSNFRQLASPIYKPILGVKAENRIDAACQHIHRNFTRKIPLNEMGRIVGMTETSFCRFFKKMTGKAFTDYVNDLRTSRARKLLTESPANISEVAYASGFESMTHFNRVFLKKNGISPREYRNRMKTISERNY